jgi:hypothetical protein
MTTVKIKSGDWEVEAATTKNFEYPSDARSFITSAIDSAVKNYIEPKSSIKQSDLDIRDNQIMLLKEDLEVVHMYLDGLRIDRKDESGETYSIVGRIKELEKRFFRTLSEVESSYLKMQDKMIKPELVDDLLSAQRGNCYVAVLSKCKDEEIAKAAGNAPEPGGNWKKYYMQGNNSAETIESLDDIKRSSDIGEIELTRDAE